VLWVVLFFFTLVITFNFVLKDCSRVLLIRFSKWKGQQLLDLYGWEIGRLEPRESVNLLESPLPREVPFPRSCVLAVYSKSILKSSYGISSKHSTYRHKVH